MTRPPDVPCRCCVSKTRQVAEVVQTGAGVYLKVSVAVNFIALYLLR